MPCRRSRSLYLGLMVGLLGASGLTAQQAERRVALVVGNGAYEKGALPNPVNDATDVAAALRDAGFTLPLGPTSSCWT